jgi:hypothetical protein
MADRPPRGQPDDKARRSAEALRANLRRRKTQERERTQAEPQERPEGVSIASPAAPKSSD